MKKKSNKREKNKRGEKIPIAPRLFKLLWHKVTEKFYHRSEGIIFYELEEYSGEYLPKSYPRTTYYELLNIDIAKFLDYKGNKKPIDKNIAYNAIKQLEEGKDVELTLRVLDNLCRYANFKNYLDFSNQPKSQSARKKIDLRKITIAFVALLAVVIGTIIIQSFSDLNVSVVAHHWQQSIV